MNADALRDWVEGKPAPMPLLAIQAFANTVDVEGETDELDSAEAFEKWLRDTGQIAAGGKVKPQHLELARELRCAARHARSEQQRQARPPGHRPHDRRRAHAVNRRAGR